ncbi:hypothetical protein LOK49_LG06G00510 [Camellia lanceoleosa]|uniref:Uncharacterized protein n=1 Tax=Camellia lanceoleosa TaxID=1840588 RepID=A0ACC0HC29_9ERIC|nr:hypothetical protein LOK49_LG06G00510 [Camellia lanceoleosa]
MLWPKKQLTTLRREVLGGPLSEEEVAAFVEWFRHNDCSQQINLGALSLFMYMHVSSDMTVWNNVQPDYAANMWNEALNKRLGTKIKDAYTLKFFENNSSRLPKWCNDADTVKLPFYQIRGKYRMELLGYNTMDPYSHMNGRCPSLPPKYSSPKGC